MSDFEQSHDLAQSESESNGQCEAQLHDLAKSESESEGQYEEQLRNLAKSEPELEGEWENLLEGDFQVKTRSQALTGPDQLFLQLCLLQLFCNEQGSSEPASGASSRKPTDAARRKEKRARVRTGIDTQELKAHMHSRGMGSGHGRMNGRMKICQPRARGGPKA